MANIVDKIIADLNGKTGVAELGLELEKIDEALSGLTSEQESLQAKIADPFKATPEEFQSYRDRLAAAKADLEALQAVREATAKRRHEAKHIEARDASVKLSTAAKADARKLLSAAEKYDRAIDEVAAAAADMLALSQQIGRTNALIEKKGFAELCVRAPLILNDISRGPFVSGLRTMSPSVGLAARRQRGEF